MFAALIIAAVTATTTPDPKVDQADADFHAISRIAQLSTNLNDQRQVMLAIVDSDLENLRERRSDDSYRWASLQREEASRVKDQKAIERVYTEKELREVSLTATNAYRFEVSVPTKQSLVSKNNRVYIRNLSVDSTGFDGKLTHHDIPVEAWVNPGDSNGIALPEIGKNVKAMVELGIEAGGQHAVADVALLQAKLVDDPSSPYYPIVGHLLKTREVLTQKNIDRGFLKTTEDESILALPGELDKRSAQMAATAERRKSGGGGIATGDASPDVLAAVQEVAHLLGGNLEDQTLARTKLQALIDSLQAKPATPPTTTTAH